MSRRPIPFQRATSRRFWLAFALLIFFLLIGLMGLSFFVAIFLTGGGPDLVAHMRRTAECGANHLLPLAASVDRYYRGTGHYPSRLEDLSPMYLGSKEILRCPADTTTPAGGVSYTYHPPVPGGSPAPLLECQHHPLMRLQVWPAGKVTPGDTRWELRTQAREEMLTLPSRPPGAPREPSPERR